MVDTLISLGYDKLKVVVLAAVEKVNSAGAQLDGFIVGGLYLKKGDVLWLVALTAIIAILVVPVSHVIFMNFTNSHAYLAGFFKFFILSTMGELLSIRIVTRNWITPKGLIFRSLIWGFLGMAIVLMFGIFSGGVTAAIAQGILPGKGSKFIWALLVSTTMNITFGPAMMIFHRFTDTFIDMKYEKNNDITISSITKRIEWGGFFSFVILKTIPLFWIPAHTIVFLLAPEYRVIAAAFLSIALGGILAFAKQRRQKT